jgi:DNA-binding NtrC family response regulator
MSVRHSVLIVDDEPAQRQLVRAVLEKEYEVTSAASGEEARQILAGRGFDLVITDQRMSPMTGIQLLEWIKAHAPETPVIILTAYGTIDSAVEAVKSGAEDYLSKPLKSPEELRLTVARVLEKKGLRDQGLVLRQEREAEFPPDVVAESREMRRVIELARQVAPLSTTVLLTGESGTGKEVVARLIHRESARREGPFVAVNCSALTETLLESELFGHEKGAFTGAVQARRGRFELAHGGTLFLDEVGDTSGGLQVKLLRVIQEQRFERVGGTRTLTVDVRMVAATNRDLGKAIEEKTFREDLFYRLNVFPVPIPPLRERRADILPLARYFLARFSSRMGIGDQVFGEGVEGALLAHDWPGNVRELQNAVERALIVSRDREIRVEDLPLRAEFPADSGSPRTLADLEKQAILEVLERNAWNRRLSAEQLGISLRTLQYRLRSYGLTRK